MDQLIENIISQQNMNETTRDWVKKVEWRDRGVTYRDAIKIICCIVGRWNCFQYTLRVEAQNESNSNGQPFIEKEVIYSEILI